MPSKTSDKTEAKDANLDLTELMGQDEIAAALNGEDLDDEAQTASANGQQGKSASTAAKANGAKTKKSTSKTQPKSGAKGKSAAKDKGGAKSKATGSSGSPSSAAQKIADAVSIFAPNAEAQPAPESFNGKVGEERLAPIRRPNGQIYRPRPVGHLTDVELLRKAREAGIPVLLGGFPGTGKTALVEAAFDGEVITMNGNADMEKADFMGSYVFRATKPGEPPEPVWVDGPLVRAMKEGKVLFVDDCTLIPANVISVLYPLMDGRNRIVLTDHESEEIVAKEGFYVCGAHNPDAPGAVLAEALSSRFSVHMRVDSDLLMAQDYFGVDPNIIGAAAELRRLRAEGEISWAPEMRELLAFKRNADVFGTQIAVNNLISVAPEDARTDVQKRVAQWFPEAEELRHTD